MGCNDIGIRKSEFVTKTQLFSLSYIKDIISDEFYFIMSFIKSHYNVTLTNDGRDAIYTLIVSMFVVGGMVGAMIGGTIADKLGRKRGLILRE